MRLFKSIVFAVLGLSLTPWSAHAFTAGPNAVHFSGSAYSAPNVFNVLTNTNTFFTSFWYNLQTAPATQGGATVLVVLDKNGSTTPTIQVSLHGDQVSNSYVEVDATDTQGRCAHFTTPATMSAPFDGRWHNVIIGLEQVGGFLEADVSVDGILSSMDGSPGNGFEGYEFDLFRWQTAASWTVGGYVGDMAEFYVDVVGDIPSELDSVIIGRFYDFTSGKAPGLGGFANSEGVVDTPCIAVSNSRSVPNMCNRGEPCHFVYGPPNFLSFWYILRPTANAFGLLSSTDPKASNDPCLFSNDGLQTDASQPDFNYVPGSGCPIQAHPP